MIPGSTVSEIYIRPCFSLSPNPARHCFDRAYLIPSMVKVLNIDILASFVIALILRYNDLRLTFNYIFKYFKKLHCWLYILPILHFLIDALENHLKMLVLVAVLNLVLVAAHFLSSLWSSEVGQVRLSSGWNISAVGDQTLVYDWLSWNPLVLCFLFFGSFSNWCLKSGICCLEFIFLPWWLFLGSPIGHFVMASFLVFTDFQNQT